MKIYFQYIFIMILNKMINYNGLILFIIILVLIYFIFFKCNDAECKNLVILKPWKLEKETETGAILKRKCINRYFFTDGCKKIRTTIEMKKYIEDKEYIKDEDYIEDEEYIN